MSHMNDDDGDDDVPLSIADCAALIAPFSEVFDHDFLVVAFADDDVPLVGRELNVADCCCGCCCSVDVVAPLTMFAILILLVAFNFATGFGSVSELLVFLPV